MTENQTKAVEAYKTLVAQITPEQAKTTDPKFTTEAIQIISKASETISEILNQDCPVVDGKIEQLPTELLKAFIDATPEHLYHFLIGGLMVVVGEVVYQ